MLHHMYCLLKGLDFLHCHGIFHRDIGDHNILMNHLPQNINGEPKYNSVRRDLEENGELLFALFDFDLALLLNTKKILGNFWLPISKAITGSPDPPFEVRYAYAVFDPFKYDVACLGIHFSEAFWHVVPSVPLLAPLMDRMVTSNIRRRFTAAEALAFIEHIQSQITPLQHSQPLPEKGHPQIWCEVDKWTGLSDSFKSEWSSFREDFYSPSKRLLNWMCRSETGYQFISWCRSVSLAISRIPIMAAKFLRSV